MADVKGSSTQRSCSPNVSEGQSQNHGTISPECGYAQCQCDSGYYTYVVLPPVKGGDRFIPFRANINIDIANTKLLRECSSNVSVKNSDADSCYQRRLSDALGLTDLDRILTFTPPKSARKCTPPTVASPLMFDFYDSTFSPPPSIKKHIYKAPLTVLDLPGLMDDFCTQLLDWDTHGRIFLAFPSNLTIWNPESKLKESYEMTFEFSHDPWQPFWSAVSCDKHGSALALGTNRGGILLADQDMLKRIRSFQSNDKKHIGALTWGHNFFVSGTQSNVVFIHDARAPDENYAQLKSQYKGICGLAMHRDGRYLASGDVHGHVDVWDLRMMSRYLHIKAHSAACRAIAWCPWKGSIIATGGGLLDGHVRLHNNHTGKMVHEQDCKSQVCSLLWSKLTRELMTSHGSPGKQEGNVIRQWRWSSNTCCLSHVATLTCHLTRPLHISLRPGGTILASASPDDRLCLWDCFHLDKNASRSSKHSAVALFQSIR